MTQATGSNETINQRINIIIAVVVAIIAVLGSFITKLESEASIASNKASVAEQQFYYQAIGKQITGKANLNHAFGTVYQLWYQYEVQRLSAQKRGEADAVKTYTELRDAVAATSPLFDPKYFDANTGKVNLTLYEADEYRTDLYELEEKQLAADEVSSAWDDKSSKYTLQLTLLAVAGFLLGLALMTKARISTLVFAFSGILMVIVISVWAYQVSTIPIIERPTDAITAFAKGASFVDQRNWDEALKTLNMAIEKAGADKPYGRAYLLRAQVHSARGEFVEAINDYQIAIDSGITADPTVDTNLVRAYFYIGDFENAIRIGNTAIKNSPDNLALLQQVNMAVLASGDTRAAEEQAALLLKKATEKVNTQKQLGDNNAAAEFWWLLDDAAHQYDQLVKLLKTNAAISPVKQNIDDPITVGKKARELASRLRAGALALKHNISEDEFSTSSANIDIKAIAPLRTPDQKYVYKVNLEFLYSGIKSGQLLSIVTYRNGIEEPSWSFSQEWTDEQNVGTANYTLSPSFSSLYIAPPGLYTVHIYLNDDLLAQGEFEVGVSNDQPEIEPDNTFAFDSMLDQFQLSAADLMYGYSGEGSDDVFDSYFGYVDPYFLFGEGNIYEDFLAGSYNFYTDYCADPNDLACFTAEDSDGDGVPDEIDSCAVEPGSWDFDGCPVTTDDADGDEIPDDSDLCPYINGSAENDGCPIEVSESDSDADGISDEYDYCPDDPGLAENGGCPGEVTAPDSDGDGITDTSDTCPEEAGAVENGGCPDAINEPDADGDGDGFPDSVDGCPNEPGEDGGCPTYDPDSDGDGISDYDDYCPDEAGPPENGGCP